MTNRYPLAIVSGAFKELPSGDKLLTNLSATGGAGLSIPHGAAPTSPVNGDFWSTTTGFYGRVNGATVGPLVGAGAITTSGLTMATARLLGRTTASAGAVEEISVGTGLSLSAGVLSATGGAGLSDGDYGDVIVSGTGTVMSLDLTVAHAWSGKQDLTVGGDLTPASTPSTTSIGYLGAPINTQNGTYGLVMADAGKCIYHSSGSAHTWTIPANGSVAFPVGTVIVLQNENGGGNLTIAITTDTLRWGPSTGSRTLAANGTATILKVTSTTWRMTGDGIT